MLNPINTQAVNHMIKIDRAIGSSTPLTAVGHAGGRRLTTVNRGGSGYTCGPRPLTLSLFLCLALAIISPLAAQQDVGKETDEKTTNVNRPVVGRIIVPDYPRPPNPPVPPQPPTPIAGAFKLTTSTFLVVQGDEPALVLTSPHGLVTVNQLEGPVHIRGYFADSQTPDKIETRIYKSKYIYSIEALKDGSCELIVVPTVKPTLQTVIRRNLEVGTILPPTPKELPTLSISSITVSEGNVGMSTATLAVSLSEKSTSRVTVNYETHDGTATAGKDYLTIGGTLTFDPGELIRTIAVPIVGDTVKEPDETVTVHLHNPIGAKLGVSESTITIRNDDETPDPGPTPSPAPIPVDGFRVLFVVETKDQTKLPKEQITILMAKSVRDYLNQKAVKESDGGVGAKIWDQNANTVNELPHWQAAMKRPRTSLPWLIISNGKEGYEGPMPKTVDETLTLLKKFGG